MRSFVAARVLGGCGPLAVMWPAFARANVPLYLTEQGRLFDAAGVPIVVPVAMQFDLYEDATAGASLWTETQTISPDAGYFSAELGSKVAFPAGLFASAASGGKTLFLGVTVNAEAIVPRQPLQSVPYALVADNAIGDIAPRSVAIGATVVINAQGEWVGPAAGLLGPTGPGGQSGAPGPTGPGGGIGAQGPAGPMGAQGSPGAAGPAGPPGGAGAVGATGAQGVAGAKGATGAGGAMGPTGPQGPAGSQGGQGPAGSVSSCMNVNATTSIASVGPVASCPAGTILAGGGCSCGGLGGVANSYPGTNDWICFCNSTQSGAVAFAVCCN